MIATCPNCNGDGVIIEAGSCGGGCEFCPPGRGCQECCGTGEIEIDNSVCREPGCDEPAEKHGQNECIYCGAHCKWGDDAP